MTPAPLSEARPVGRSGWRRPTGRSLFLAVLLVVLAVYTEMAFELEWRTAAGRIGPGFFPRIIGILSLILWSLVLIISVKYVAIVLRADNRGEGGVLALSTLVSSASSNWRVWAPVSAVGVFGAALFFGDGFITPAISVLSAASRRRAVSAARWASPAFPARRSCG